MTTPDIPLILVPCFSGAPWDVNAFPAWKDRTVITGQLPNLGSIEDYATLVESWTKNLDEYILVGDSFGAFVALALAQRQPRGLRALVMSGGFAKADVSALTRFRVLAGKALGQAGYPVSVYFHVQSLGSHFDPPGTDRRLRDIFLRHTDARTFVRRGEMTLSADLRPGLARVQVPTLLLTPQDDRLIGPAAAQELLHGIPGAEEIVLAHSGHLLRFTHEREYARIVDDFLGRRLSAAPGAASFNPAERVPAGEL